MKEELIKLWNEFVEYVDDYNRIEKPVLEDDVELTFENFIKWLRWEKRSTK